MTKVKYFANHIKPLLVAINPVDMHIKNANVIRNEYVIDSNNQLMKQSKFHHDFLL